MCWSSVQCRQHLEFGHVHQQNSGPHLQNITVTFVGRGNFGRDPSVLPFNKDAVHNTACILLCWKVLEPTSHYVIFVFQSLLSTFHFLRIVMGNSTIYIDIRCGFYECNCMWHH